MKKIISILFLFTMLLQAIPVLHFFAEKPEIFYAVSDEEKPVEKTKEIKEDKGEDKAFLSFYTTASIALTASIIFQSSASQLPSSPHLEMVAPPPDFCSSPLSIA